MSLAAPLGFTAAGLAAGIKASGAPDLALVAADPVGPVAAAAVFTSNLAAAAPVQVSRAHLRESGGRIGAVVLNSGCANAATGEAGVATAKRMTALAGEALGLGAGHVLVCSTGLIGFELPPEPLERGIPALVAQRAGGLGALREAAVAIMTTDTREKLSSAVLSTGACVTGIAKGAAMLAPNMATMLAVVLTDAALEPGELDAALRAGVDRSFNRLSIDGCTSTNDTVIALASGQAGPAPAGELAEAITAVCRDLAHQMAADAEGGTKVVRVVVTGALSDEEAQAGARKVADANLVKCSWYGGDPNWGRVVSELGTAGIGFRLSNVSVAYGPHVVCAGGRATECDEAALASYLAGDEIELRCDLGLGSGVGEILSADLTHAYIDENMGLS